MKKTTTIKLARGEKIVNRVFKNQRLVLECEGDNLIQGCTMTGYLWRRKGPPLLMVKGGSVEFPVRIVNCNLDGSPHSIPERIHSFCVQTYRRLPWVRRAEERARDKAWRDADPKTLAKFRASAAAWAQVRKEPA